MRLSTAIAISSLFYVEIRGQAADLPWPTRELEWKDVNFLSVSDTHGWLLGHQHATWPEPNYSGTYGEFASFVAHMRALADDKGVDLLLVDAGDHHDGTGLVSSSRDSSMRAEDIMRMLPYDLLSVGNHELYEYWAAKDVYDHRNDWGGSYLTSNVNITVEQDGRPVSVPLGQQSVKFTTKQGRRVTAFGVIFNFQADDANITVQSPALLATEPWFLQEIEEAPDYFVLVGHMSPRGDESSQFGPVLEAIRQRHPHVPVYIFGGHTHGRDCVQYDDHSIAVMPGRYMETVAFTSSSLPDEQNPSKPLDMARRYLDANRRSYMYHSRRTSWDFDTPLGVAIDDTAIKLGESLNISNTLGMAPNDLFLTRYPTGHPRHVHTVWTNEVFPATIFDESRRGRKRVFMANGGSLRFDLFQGTFNRNDELTLSPFHFVYAEIPAGLARRLTAQMNANGPTKLFPDQHDTGNSAMREYERIDKLYRQTRMLEWERYLSENGQFGTDAQMTLGSITEPLTMGYVTHDACPGRGDDIEHIPVPFSPQLDFVESQFPDAEDDELIDLIVMTFTLDDFFIALKTLDPLYPLAPDDMKVYGDGTKINAIWGMYAQMAWQ